MPEIKIGYKLCGEEQSTQELIAGARRAEEVGFDFFEKEVLSKLDRD